MNKLQLWWINTSLNRKMNKVLRQKKLERVRVTIEIQNHKATIKAPKIKNTNDLRLILLEFCETLE